MVRFLHSYNAPIRLIPYRTTFLFLTYTASARDYPCSKQKLVVNDYALVTLPFCHVARPLSVKAFNLSSSSSPFCLSSVRALVVMPPNDTVSACSLHIFPHYINNVDYIFTLVTRLPVFAQACQFVVFIRLFRIVICEVTCFSNANLA